MKSFKEIWESRNPFHEINLDTGEDMFWKTAQMVAEEFCGQKSQAGAEILELNAINSGLRFAASELQFRVDKQNEHIAILKEEAKKKDERIKELEDGLRKAIGTIEMECDDLDYMNELKQLLTKH